MSYQSSNFRSPKLLKAFQYAPYCFSCGKVNHDNQQIVAAHANWIEFGKSGGMKAQDWAVAGLCLECHSDIDQGHAMSYEERKEKWMSAWIKTIDWMFRANILGVK